RPDVADTSAGVDPCRVKRSGRVDVHGRRVTAREVPSVPAEGEGESVTLRAVVIATRGDRPRGPWRHRSLGDLHAGQSAFPAVERRRESEDVSRVARDVPA